MKQKSYDCFHNHSTINGDKINHKTTSNVLNIKNTLKISLFQEYKQKIKSTSYHSDQTANDKVIRAKCLHVILFTNYIYSYS